MNTQQYTVNLKNVPVGMVDADFQRYCQAICDVFNAPGWSKTDRLRHAWQVMSKGTPKQANDILEILYGERMTNSMLGTYTKNMSIKGELTKVSHGLYRYTGNPTANTMPGAV